MAVSLPMDHVGKTLTIVQSTGLGEKQIPEAESTVYFCGVTLSCGYAYESALIAESFRTAIPAALCFALGLLLCAAFLWQGFRGRWDAGLALAALAVFSLMLSPLAAVSFLGRYLPYPQTDWNALCRALRLTALLVFLGERGGGRLRWVLWCAAALHGLTALLGRSAAASPLTTVSEYVGLLGLVAASVLAMVWMKRENRFYRLFAPLFLAALGLGVAVWGVHALAEPQWGQELLLQLRTGFQMGLPRFLLWKLSLPALGAGVLAALIHLLQTEAERRTEARLLLQRGGAGPGELREPALTQRGTFLPPPRHEAPYHGPPGPVPGGRSGGGPDVSGNSVPASGAESEQRLHRPPGGGRRPDRHACPRG